MSPDADREPRAPRRAPAWQRPFVKVRPAAALGDRLVLELARRKRQGVPFGLIAIHHPLWHDDGPGARERLEKHLIDDVAAIVRVSDAVYRAGLPGCHVLVLPHTSPACVGVPLERIEARVRETANGDAGPAGVEAIPVLPEDTDASALLARIDAHFRERALGRLDDRVTERIPARLPVGDASRLEEALHTEINLAGRDGTSLSVVALCAPASPDSVPGLLACDVDEVAARVVRGCDQVFELGPTSVALVLARTAPDAAESVARRIVEELREQDPAEPHGTLSTFVLEFDRTHRDAPAFLAALRRLAG